MSDTPHPAPLGPYRVEGFFDRGTATQMARLVGPTNPKHECIASFVQHVMELESDAYELNAAYAAGLAAGKGDMARAVEAERERIAVFVEGIRIWAITREAVEEIASAIRARKGE